MMTSNHHSINETTGLSRCPVDTVHPHRPQCGAGRIRYRVFVGALPLVVGVAVSGAASATTTVSDTIQPGVTSPPQPGTVAPPPPPPPADDDSPAVRNDASWRPVPQSSPAPPVDLGRLHLPGPVPPVAPIKPPPNVIRIGDFVTPSPAWLPPAVRDQINSTAAGAEAGVARLWDSIGIGPRRSDRLAAATTAGTGIGVIAGAAVAGVPVAGVGAVVGGLVGGTIGGIVGAAAGTLIPVPVVGTVTSGVAGTAIGAAAGALIGGALAGVPAAAIGAVAGGVVGGGVGAAVGVGQ